MPTPAVAKPGTVNTLQPTFGFGSAPKSTGLLGGIGGVSTPTTVAAGTPTSLTANLGIGGSNSLGSSPTFQPVQTSFSAPQQGVGSSVVNPNIASVKPAAQSGTQYNTQATLPPAQSQTNPVLSTPPPGTADGVLPGTPATLPGITNSLANTATQGSAPAQQYTQATAQAGEGNTAIGQSAANIAANYGKQIAAVGQQGANAQAGYQSTGTTPVALGNAGIIAQNVAAQQTALAQGEQGALQGTAQQLTAQGQEATAENAAAGQALGQQQTSQSGLAAAGQLAAPGTATQQVAPGSTVLNSDNEQVFSGLGSLSQYQAEQLSNAQRGTYGAQSQSISTGLSAMSNTYQNVQAIAQANGINPTQYPTANALISALQANITSPGGQAAFTEAMNSLKTQIAQQVQNFASTGAITPTVSSSYTTALNSTNLSPTELGQLYDAVTATGLANLNADATAFNQSNQATQNATLPSSFGSSQPQSSTYTPPANITGTVQSSSFPGTSYVMVNGQWQVQ